MGYHYAPLDYLLNNVQASNVAVHVTDGAVLSYGHGVGLWLFAGSSLHCEGTPTRRNGLVHKACVQEQPVAWPVSGLGAYPVVPYRTSTSSIEANFRFTQFTPLAPGSSHLAQCDDYSHSLLSARDCQSWGGNIGVWPQFANQSAQLTFANNMFARVSLTLYSDANITFDGEFRNNTVVGGTFSEDTSSCAQWLVRDNLFYHWDWMDIMGDHAFNAYVGTNQLWPWPELTTNDVVLTNFTFPSGPLGDYYHGSTNLMARGSLTNAALAGLYHHTTRTKQAKEANTHLDIGFHYVACGTNGLPVDTDAHVQRQYKDCARLNDKLLTQIVEGGRTTSYTYYPDDTYPDAVVEPANRLKRVDYPDGNWVYYKYDTLGRQTEEYAAYGNSPAPTGGQELDPAVLGCKKTVHAYDWYGTLMYEPESTATYLPVYNEQTQGYDLQETARASRTWNPRGGLRPRTCSSTVRPPNRSPPIRSTPPTPPVRIAAG